MSAQGIEDRGHRSRWSDTYCGETPTDQYIKYNIKGAVWRLVSSCENDSTVRDLEFPLPPLPLPPLPKKNHPQPTQNTSPSRLPHHQWADPGTDSLISPHLRIKFNQLCGPHRGFVPETNKRPRVSACHRQEHESQALLTSDGNNNRGVFTPRI
jgi:hypothetical protein